MIRRRKFIVILATLASLFILLICILNLAFRFMDISPYQLQIAEAIEKTINRKISIGDARLSFINGLDIILEGVTIEEKNKKEHFMRSDRLIVSFYFLPLLNRHLAIKKIQIIGPHVQIYRTGEKGTSLDTLINKVIPSQFFSKIQTQKTRFPIMNKLTIKKGHLTVRDMKVSKKPLITEISDFNLDIWRSFRKRSILGLMQGKVMNETEPAQFRIETEIQNMEGNITLDNLLLKGKFNLKALNLNQFQPYLMKFSWAKGWKGLLNANAAYEGSFANGFKVNGDTDIKSFGSLHKPVLSDPLKVHHWGIDYDLFWDKEKLDIHQFKFKLSDSIFTGKSLIRAPFSKNPQINFEFQSTPFDLKSFANNLPVSFLPPSIRIWRNQVIKGKSKFESIQFEGNFNQLKNIYQVKNFKHIKGEISADKVDFRIGADGPIVKKISGLLTFNGKNIEFSNVSGAYKNSKISKLSGTISNSFEKPEIDVSAKASLQLEQIQQILATQSFSLKNDWNFEKTNDISGRAEIQIHVSGRLKKPLELKHSGNVEFKKVAFTNNDLVHHLSNINGKVRFYSEPSLVPNKDKEMKDFLQKIKINDSVTGKLYYFSGLSGKYGQSEIMNISGGIYGISKQPVFNLKIDSDILLNEIHPMLITYLNANNLFEGLNNINIISGRSKMIAKINNHSSGINKLDFSGGLQLKNVYASYYKFPLRFSKLKGNIFFTKKELEWKGIYGFIGKSKFNLNGKTVDYTLKSPKIDLQIDSDANLNEILNTIQLPEKDTYLLNGIASLKLKLNGDYNALTTKGKLDLTQSSYQYKNWLEKKSGQENIFFWDGFVEKLNNFYFEKFEATYQGNKIFGDGTISNLINPHLDFRIHTSDFKLEDAPILTDFLKKRSITGKLSTSFNVKWHLKDARPLEIKGKAALKNGSYKFSFSPKAIKKINAKLDFSNQKITIKNTFFSFGESEANIRGEIVNFDKPVFNLRLKSKNLDLNPLLPEKARSIKEINSLFKNSPLFLSTRGKIDLDAEKGQYISLKFPHITGEIELKNGLIKLNKMKVFFGKKYAFADAFLDFLSDQGLNFSLKLHGRSFEVEKFERVFEKYFKDSISGRLSLATLLMGKGYNLNEISKSLSGNLSLLLMKGDYNKQNLISGITKIFGFDSETTENNESLASKNFDVIKGNFAINNGVAITQNYAIETPERRTSVIGTFDMGNKKLDLSIGVAPWKNLNETVSKIPIVGTIVTGGDDKSLFINYYNVKGKMESPEVKAVPLKSLGKKVVSLFKGIFQTPKEIFAPAK